MTGRRSSLAVGALAMVLALTGCASQIAGLAPVSGDTPAAIRAAAIDVLLERRLTIRDAPQCASTGDGWSCAGSLTDGSAIIITAAGTKPTDMTVLVGDVTVYEGSIQVVLDRAAGIDDGPAPESGP